MGARFDSRWLALALLVASSCRCASPVERVGPAELVIDPGWLDFGSIYAGSQARGAVEVVNQGGATASIAVGTQAPFASDVTHLELPRGVRAIVTVTFAPDAGGAVSGLLQIGELAVPLSGTGLEVPECVAPAACTTSTFDLASGACVQAQASDGTACHTRCVSGACSAGTCVGSLVGCDDQDACTVDACSEQTGCEHLPRTCPAPAAVTCRVAACDPTSGCGEAVAPDGTVCGVDDCAAIEVNVCISGQCVTRSRPVTGQCTNRWVPTTAPARAGHAMVYDAASQRVVLMGGIGRDGESGGGTWEWDGRTWTERYPATSGGAVLLQAAAYDSFRRRVVSFGGVVNAGAGTGLIGGPDGTSEWDGVTWVTRTSTTAPPPLSRSAMAYDPARRRTVLFGGGSWVGAIDETWEWDGVGWTRKQPGTRPAARCGHSLAWDTVRRQVMLFGGMTDAGTLSDETWTWDGSMWSRLSPGRSPPARFGHAMASDEQRRRVVVFGGEGDGGAPLADTWEWDGQTWTPANPPVSPAAREEAAMAYDAVHGELVLFGGSSTSTLDTPHSDTWAWDGTSWSRRGPPDPPSPRHDFALAYDSTRKVIVLFGGSPVVRGFGSAPDLADTWEFDGAAWIERTPARAPPARHFHSMAYDELRHRVVLSGGVVPDGGSDLSIWEWDGSSWSLAPAATGPTGSAAALGWDPGLQRTLLLANVASGSGPTPTFSAESWAWDGATWTHEGLGASLPFGTWAMSADSARQNLVAVSAMWSVPNDPQTWVWQGGAWARSAAPAPMNLRGVLGLADDRARQRLVLFGAASMLIWGGFPETWEWDGTSWTRRQPVTSPAVSYTGQSHCALAYDAARQRVTLFDGFNTWRWVP